MNKKVAVDPKKAKQFEKSFKDAFGVKRKKK